MPVSYALQNFFSFIGSNLLIVDLSVCATGVLFRKLSLGPLCSRLLPTYPSIIFSVSGFMLRSLIHLKLNFVQDVKHKTISVLLLHEDTQFDSTILEDVFFCSMCISVFFIKNQMSIYVWVYV